jgi:hypothetical protein
VLQNFGILILSNRQGEWRTAGAWSEEEVIYAVSDTCIYSELTPELIDVHSSHPSVKIETSALTQH